MQVPLSDVSDTRDKRESVVDTHGKMGLRVIGVLVVVNTMVCDDILLLVCSRRRTTKARAQTPEERRPRVPGLATDADPA